MLSAVLLQPADLLKTRVQQSGAASLLPTLRAILAAPEPIRHLWRGTLPSALRTGVGSALYFSSLNALRERVALGLFTPPSRRPVHSASHSSTLPTLSNAANLTTGAAARATVGTLLMPVTVIKVRFESDIYAYRSLLSAGLDILRRDGARGLFAGVGATAARDAPYAGLYVLFYEQCKRRLSRLVVVASPDGPRRITGATAAGINFVSGVGAAAIATFITNPFDAIKTRLQLMPREYRGMLQAGKRIVRQDGARALLDGLGLRMARKGLSSALAWTVYEEVVRRGVRSRAGAA